MSAIGKSIKAESELVVTRVWGRLERGVMASASTACLLGVAKSVLELDNGDGCRTLRIYQKSWSCLP